MGMRNIMWDADTEDWNMPAPGGGKLSPKVVDAKFQSWIDGYKSGKDRSGKIVLEHELNHATINISMYWMPKLQKVFNVVPALTCNGITQPYWENNFVYPMDNEVNIMSVLTKSRPKSTTTIISTTNIFTKTTSNTSTPTSRSCISGVEGRKQSNGRRNYCCTTSDDCFSNCQGGKCTY